MHDTLPVSDSDAGADVAHQRDRAFRIEHPLSSYEVAQRCSVHQLHHDISRCAVCMRITEIMNRHDIGVSDQCCGPGLASEAFNAAALAEELWVEHLNGHFITDVKPASAINGAHSTFSQERAQFVLGVEHPSY